MLTHPRADLLVLAYCVDCSDTRQVDRHGHCATCQSESLLHNNPRGALIRQRNEQRKDGKRFLRGGRA